MTRINPDTGRAEWVPGDKGEKERPIRTWFRERGLVGREGLNIQDLDIAINCFGKLIGRNHSEDGRIKLIETKVDIGWIEPKMTYAQRRTFELLHKLLRSADPGARFYRGLYTVSTPLCKKSEEFNNVNFDVTSHPDGNKKIMDPKEFLNWLQDLDVR